MFPHALEVHLVCEFRVVAHHVQLELQRIAAKLLRLEVRLVLEQEVVHRPELSLPGRRFGSLCRTQGVRMHFLERGMPEDEPHAAGELFEEQLHDRRGLLAVGALEIPVLDEGDLGMQGAERVVGGTDRP